MPDPGFPEIQNIPLPDFNQSMRLALFLLLSVARGSDSWSVHSYVRACRPGICSNRCGICSKFRLARILWRASTFLPSLTSDLTASCSTWVCDEATACCLSRVCSTSTRSLLNSLSMVVLAKDWLSLKLRNARMIEPVLLSTDMSVLDQQRTLPKQQLTGYSKHHTHNLRLFVVQLQAISRQVGLFALGSKCCHHNFAGTPRWAYVESC